MRRNFKLLLIVLALVAIGSSFSFNLTRRSFAAQSGARLLQDARPYAQDVDKLLRRYDKLELDPAMAAELVKQTGRFFLPTTAGGFDLTLAPHDLRAARYRAQETLDGGVIRELERSPVRTYKGSVAGIPGGQARLTIDKGTFEGLIITPSQIYFVEPAKRYSSAASDKDFIVYQQADLLQTSFGECGLTMAEKVGKEAFRLQSQPEVAASLKSVTEELFTPPRTVDLATEADFEYFTFFGNATNANNEIIAIMNMVEGIYNSQFGLKFAIVFQNVWTFSGDPYTATNADVALNEFTGYWNANHAALERDLAHMWTGKNFDGNTIGIAWRPGLDCPLGQNGYGMSQILSATPDKFILTAHEIGHGFNATHADAQPGCANSIMGTTLGPFTSQTFCPFSVTEIETHANAKVACLAQALTPGCTYSLSAGGQSVGSLGGSGSVNVNTTGTNCVWSANSAVPWIIITSGSNGTNSGTVNFAVGPNTNGFARNGLIRIAEQNFVVTQAGAPNCTTVPISFGQTVNGSLSGSDCQSSKRVNTFADQYSFSGVAGQLVSISMSRTSPSTLDTYLYLIGPTGSVVSENDDLDPGVDLNSRIPPFEQGWISLPITGSYTIEATSFDQNFTGTYALTLLTAAQTSIQLSQATFTVTEGIPRVNIGVSRSGVISGTATVDYATSDSAGLNNCNAINGLASSRCDYASSVGTVTIASGSAFTTFSIPIVDDSYAEGTESFTITLSNPTGPPLGSQASATITISDNEISTGPNPIVGTAFFVRQHYIDFLGREPDPTGFQDWQNTINNCPAGNTTCDRIHVSGAFFQSSEFQQRGYFVYRFYPTAFGRKPDYSEFIPDLARVSGFLSDAQLEAAKVTFVNDFMNRQAFMSTYNALSNTQYVDTLLATAGVTSPNRDFWIAALGNGTRTRATVLRDIAESQQVYDKYYNQSFVVMQYFGYLRRDPDASYLNWIQELNTTGDSRNMINGFVNSPEYFLRFGP